MAPTGGTFVQSTGVKTVPVGYTAAPVTPVLTERTYRTQAPVNPANDPDSVTLVWTLPAESPEYDAAGLADDAADRAAASAAEAAGSVALVESYSGPVQIVDGVAFTSDGTDIVVLNWRTTTCWRSHSSTAAGMRRRISALSRLILSTRMARRK